MLRIIKYSFFDLIRSRWMYLYLGFYLLLTLALLNISGDLSKAILSLMNVVLILSPLIAIMFGVMHYYTSHEFTELLLAQPLKRTTIFWGQYLGLASSLSLSLALGIGLPFLLYGLLASAEIFDFFFLILAGILLSFIFSGLAFYIALKHNNRIRGFGLAILLWLFFTVIYDGLFLLGLLYFKEYPLDQPALAGVIFNPIDLSRILLLLQLDASALMGYTGAVFQRFFGTYQGMVVILLVLISWCAVPMIAIRRAALRKDF